jgi:hypothetical protein
MFQGKTRTQKRTRKKMYRQRLAAGSPSKIECFVFDVPMLFGDVLLHDPGRVIRIRCISKTCKNGHCFMKTR